MDPNTISATLSIDDQQAIRAAVETLRQKLPFLIDLTMEERKAIAKLGDKTQGFVQKAWEIANQHEHLFAAAFLDEMRKDAQLLDVLSAIELSIQTLAKKLNDTKMQVGAEAYAAARTVYLVTKTPFAKAALRDASDDLARHYGRKRKTEASTPTQPSPTTTAHS